MSTVENQNDINVVIEVSADKVEAHLTLVPLTESPRFSTDQVKKALAEKGIKFGIYEEVLALLEEQVRYNKKILIASGIRPANGEEGTVKCFFESNRRVKVKKGAKVAEIVQPGEGSDGITVFEEKIPSTAGKKAALPELKNVRTSTENASLLVAKIDGYLLINESGIRIAPFFELEKSANTDEAFVKVKKPLQPGDFNAEDLRRFLKDNGIVYGICEEEIESIFSQNKFDQRILVSCMDKDKAAAAGQADKDFTVAIEISRDQIEAYLTVIPLTESPVFSTGPVREALSEKGIKSGIKEDVLAGLEKEVKYNEPVLIAAGVKPAPGKDGTISYFFDSKQTVKVKKHQKIGEIIPSEKGSDGVTIFEEKVPAPEPERAYIPDSAFIGPSPENKNILVSKFNGYLSFDEAAFQPTPFFELDETTTDYEAFVKVARPLQDGDFDAEDLKRFLSEKGILFGVLDQEIEKVFKEKKFQQPVLVARGQQVLDEKDGEVKYFFDTEASPQVDARGNIDYKELNLIQNVRAGDPLAETADPSQGIEGCTIFGQKITPKKGVRPTLPKGLNTQPDPKNPNVLVAEIDGSVKLKGATVAVEPIIVIKEDVDFSTGNIDFHGSVIVNRDVKSGFKIYATDDVQVNGVVEDAEIEAGGKVMIKAGFIGRGEGRITAQQEVAAKFCENENIIGESDILISDYVMNSMIKTKGRLVVMDQTGLIVGGESYAVKGIEAKVIGNKNYAPTAVFAGFDQEVEEFLRVKRAYLAKNAEHIKEINKTFFKLSQRRLVKKPLPEGLQNVVKKLNQLKTEKEEENKVITAEIEKLEGKVEEFKKALVIVSGVVYPGTTVAIYNRRLAVNEALKSVYFKYTEKEVVAADLDELSQPA
ncbi:MAG: DUF342 domain-containing protein [Candidatus Glassbacteria bacterium]|nr:DUF342 domain-containing protein [Candidatus Glassbacteria bacterium]